MIRAVTSSVKSNPNGSARVSENQRDMNGHSKGHLSKLPDDVFTNISEKYLSRKEMAHFSCVSKEIESDLNKIAQRFNYDLKNKLDQKITKTKIVGIQISPGPFRNDIQKLSVLEMQNNNLGTATTVLEANNIININEMTCGLSELYIAVSMGNATVVDALIAAGADVNKADEYECTPLLCAASNGDVTVVDALIAAGADVNKANEYESTPLLRAIRNGDEKVVAALIAAGADVNMVNESGWTPLFWAASEGNATVVAALIAAGANVNMVNKFGWTPLHFAAREGNATGVEALVIAGADVNAQDKIKWTALHWAVSKGKLEIVKALVNAGADVNVKNKYGLTALQLAKYYGHYDKVKNAIKEGKKKLIGLYLSHVEKAVTSPIHECESLREPLLQNEPENLTETQKKQAIKYIKEQSFRTKFKIFGNINTYNDIKKYFWK